MGVEECELCGTKANDIYIVSVEDVELRVCAKCAKGKKIIARAADSRKERARVVQKPRKSEEISIVENYGQVIHNARESMKLPLKVLAEMINEKETLLLRVERQRTIPSVELAKKLEKALGIKLNESEETQQQRQSYGSGEKFTIGDYVTKKE